MKKLFILFIVLAGFAVDSFGQATVTTAVNATATIRSPLAVVKVRDLAFGNITPDNAGASTVVITSAGDGPTITASGLTTVSGTFNNAKFTVAGDAGSTYKMTMPTSVNLISGALPLMVCTLSTNASATANPIALAAFWIGGSLAVATRATQTAGAYSGSFNVIVAYE